MSVLGLKISELPLYDGTPAPAGYLPIVINGVTYQIETSLIVEVGSASLNKIFYWDGNPFTVPASFSGTLWNITRNAPVTYALSGTTLTPTSGEADSSETLLATSN